MTKTEKDELLALRNELRASMESHGLNADDMSKATLQNIKKILGVIVAIEKERDDALVVAENSKVNFSSVAKGCGMDRQSLSDNSVYKKIILAHREPKHITQQEIKIKSLETDLSKANGVIKDYERKDLLKLDYKLKILDLQTQIEDERRAHENTRTALRQAQEGIQKRDGQIAALMNALNPNYTAQQ